MQELILQLVQSLGVQENQAKGGVGLIMTLAQDQLGGDFSKIATELPGVADLIKSAPQPGAAATLIGGFGSMLGGKAQGLAGLASLATGFGQLKMDSSLVGKFVPVIMTFVQSKAGPQVSELLSKVLTQK